MLVTLPFVLLLLDYWPLDRLEFVPLGLTTQKGKKKYEIYWPKGAVVLRLVLEKIPLLTLTALSSIVTFLAQRSGGALESLGTIPLNARLANAFVTYMCYMGKTVWPHDLAVFYPHPGPSLPLWQVAGAVLSLLAITLLVLRAVRSHPYLITGWLWYLGTLVPVIGIVQVGAHAMADRYTYVPLIGLSIVVAWGLPDMLARRPHRKAVLAPLTAGFLAVLMMYSLFQVRCWKNSSTLFQHALDVTTNNWLAHNNMGMAVASEGDGAGALSHYQQSLRINPKNAEAHNNLGIALVQHKSPREAGLHFEAALHLKPDFAEAHYNLGGLLLTYGKLDDAVFHYHQAVKNEPDDPQIHNNMANALLRRGDVCEAISHYREALRLEPESAATLHNLEVALTMQRTRG
jgi:Flp pilus assembly protein TadD